MGYAAASPVHLQAGAHSADAQALQRANVPLARARGKDLPHPSNLGGVAHAVEELICSEMDAIEAESELELASTGRTDDASTQAKAAAHAEALGQQAGFTVRSRLYQDISMTFNEFVDTADLCFVDPLASVWGAAPAAWTEAEAAATREQQRRQLLNRRKPQQPALRLQLSNEEPVGMTQVRQMLREHKKWAMNAAELVAGGANRRVTVQNAREWVALIRARWLDRDVAQQAHAFVQGGHDVLPPLSRALVGFSAAELQAMFCGTHSLDPLADGRWSTRALRAQAIAAATSGNNDNGLPSASVLKSGSGMEVGSQSLRLLYETLALGSRAFRKRFLLFVTGLPSPSPSPIEVVPFADSFVPRAQVCARKLYLPFYTSVRETFDGFALAFSLESDRGYYEWRS